MEAAAVLVGPGGALLVLMVLVDGLSGGAARGLHPNLHQAAWSGPIRHRRNK